MEHLIGYIIIALSIVLTSIFLFIKWRAWKRYQPTWTHRGIGVIYQEDAVGNWVSKELINAIIEVGNTTAYKRNLNFWIEVVPYHREVQTPTVPTGYLKKDGRMAGKPKSILEAKEIQKVMGSIKTARFLPITKLHHVAVVVQSRVGLTKEEIRMGIGDGVMQDVGDSAIFHEVAQHLLPGMSGEGVNANHSREDLKTLQARMETVYRNFKAAKSG